MPTVRRFQAAVTAVAFVTMSVFVTAVQPAPAYAFSVPSIDLGRAAPFAILAGASVGNTATGPTTIVRGDLGVLAAAGLVTGFPPGEVTGTLFASGAPEVVNAHADLVLAYADAVSRTTNFALAGDLIGGTLHPGVHTNAGAVANTGTVTLDGDGNANSVFIFQVNGALAMAAGSKVILTNGTQAKNVFWQVEGAGAIGAAATFAGTLMTSAAIGVGAESSFNGRALAKTGAITTNSNQFYSNPPVVTIGGGPTVAISDDTPTISGSTTVDLPATVAVTVGTQTLTAPVQLDGTWTVTAAILANGIYEVTAAVADLAGNTGFATQQLTIDTILPVVTIDGGAARLTNDATPTISGTTDVGPGSIVTVAAGGQTLTTLVQANGSWNITPASLTDIVLTVTASVHDEAGNLASVTQVVTLDATAPVVTITGGAIVLTNDVTPTISGTTVDVADVGAMVMVRVAGQTLTTAVQADRSWTVTADVAANGTHTVAVSIIDLAGNVGTAIQTLMVDTTAPVISIAGGSSAATNDTTPSISGASDAASGSTINVTVDSQTLTALVLGNGTWMITAGILANGIYPVSVSVDDVAGNTGTATQSLTIDTVVPVVSITGGEARLANDSTPTIGGHTDVGLGSVVTIAVGGQTLMAVVQADGSWNVTPVALTDGGLPVVASVHDEAGNQGSATQILTLDTTAPVVTITGGATALTNDVSPTISGTTGNVADVGAMVAVTVAGQMMPTTTVQADQSWTVTADSIANGTHAVAVSIVDLAGNIGTTIQTLTVDTTAPAISITGGSSAATNDTTPTISGTATVDVPASVTVTVHSQTLTAAVQAGGAWSVSPSILASGTYAVTAAVTDRAGNTGSAAQSLTIDTIPPYVTINTAPLTNDATPAVGGTTDVGPGSIVTVTVGVQTLTALVQEDGSWNITPASLTDGVLTIVASVHDEAGNLASVTQVSTLDTRAPMVTITGGATVSTNDPTPVISGTTGDAGDVGAMVAVTVAGQTMPTTAQVDRTWAVTAATLAIGPHTVSVSIADRAGNIGMATQTLTVDEAAIPPTIPPTIPPSVPPTVPPAMPLAMNPVGPKRIFDTRPGQSPQALHAVERRRIGGAYELQVNVADFADLIPASGVGAVSLNVTATNSDAEGFITVYACGTREMVSSVNFTAGGTVANAVIAPVSADGAFCFFSNVAVDVVADINGWFPAGEAFTPIGPKRVFDTRPGQSDLALVSIAKTPVSGDGMIEVQITDLDRFVPALGVEAVSLNVTVVNPTASGFVTVYACGTRELVSSVNFESGQTVANAAIAPVSVAGKVCFYALAATDLVVDINGWFKTSSGFSGTSPVRLLDTRAAESPDAWRDVLKAKIGGGYVLEVKVTDVDAVVPATGVGAVSLNVTATNPEVDGFVTVFACGVREEVSSLNYTLGQTVANAVIAPVSAEGKICLFSPVPTDVVVDLNGWFASAPT